MTFNEKLEAIYQQTNISQKNTLEDTANPNKTHYLYETVTEYEINQQKRFNMKFGSVKQFVLFGCEGRKSPFVWHLILCLHCKGISK